MLIASFLIQIYSPCTALDAMTVAQLSGMSINMIEKRYGHLLSDHAANALAGLAL